MFIFNSIIISFFIVYSLYMFFSLMIWQQVVPGRRRWVATAWAPPSAFITANKTLY